MAEQVIVIGLGRFGSSVARELERLGHEVLGVDRDEAVVNEVAGDLTRALELDATDERALSAAGAAEFDVAVVAMSDPEPSIFATTVLKRLGVREVIAKAGSYLHGAILERVGADRIVFPERELGTQLARTLGAPNVIEYLELTPGLGVEKLRPPARFMNRTLRELALKERHELTPLAIVRGRSVIVNPAPDERIADGDQLLVIGPDRRVRELR